MRFPEAPQAATVILFFHANAEVPQVVLQKVLRRLCCCRGFLCPGPGNVLRGAPPHQGSVQGRVLRSPPSFQTPLHAPEVNVLAVE